GETYVLIWAQDEDVDLRLAEAGGPVRAMRPFGKVLPVRRSGNEVVVPIGGRSYLVFGHSDIERLKRSFAGARSAAGELRPGTP
ncbi:MAG: hypothetical protein ACYC6Y_11785, partial [Thermoguttaceae bacterium]